MLFGIFVKWRIFRTNNQLSWAMAWSISCCICSDVPNRRPFLLKHDVRGVMVQRSSCCCSFDVNAHAIGRLYRTCATWQKFRSGLGSRKVDGSHLSVSVCLESGHYAGPLTSIFNTWIMRTERPKNRPYISAKIWQFWIGHSTVYRVLYLVCMCEPVTVRQTNRPQNSLPFPKWL